MKKFLSLVLALVMTMSLVTVSAGAKDFTDADDITYVEAVEVMTAISVVDGDTAGNFNPTNGLTRGAAAKIICNLILGPTTASALNADTNPYPDVDKNSTFAGYIAYCQKEGIISGYADGTFKPAAPLTGYAFMKMLLGALGYDADVEGYTGANWSINVAKRAINIGLNDGLVEDFNGSDYVTREEAMLYAFNTLQADMVEYDAKISVGDITIAGSDVKVVEGNKYDGRISADGDMQFAEMYFTNLKKVAGAVDAFDRPATTWYLKNDKIGTYTITPDVVYTADVDLGDIYADLGLSEKIVAETYFNGSADAAVAVSKGNIRNLSADVTAVGNGTTTEVYYDQDAGTIRLVIFNTYVGEITTVKAATKAVDAYVNVMEFNNTTPLTAATKFEVENAETLFEVDDVVLFTYADGEIQSIQKIEGTEATLNTIYKDQKLTIGGETVKYAVTHDFASGNSEADLTVKSDYIYYLDNYGYIVYIIEEEFLSSDYAFVEGVGVSGGTFGVNQAKLVYTDGTAEVVNTSKDYTTDPWTNYIVTYKLDANGKTIMKQVKNSDYNTANYVNFQNGKAQILVDDVDGDNVYDDATDTRVFADSNTIVVVKNSDDKYHAYTGVKNMPSIDGDVDVVAWYCKSGSQVAKLIWVDANASTVITSGTNDITFFAVKSASKHTTDTDVDDYYTFNVVEKDEIKTMTVDAALVSTLTANYIGTGLSFNEDGHVSAWGTAVGTPFTSITKLTGEQTIGFNGVYWTVADDVLVYNVDHLGNITEGNVNEIATNSWTGHYILNTDTYTVDYIFLNVPEDGTNDSTVGGVSSDYAVAAGVSVGGKLKVTVTTDSTNVGETVTLKKVSITNMTSGNTFSTTYTGFTGTVANNGGAYNTSIVIDDIAITGNGNTIYEVVVEVDGEILTATYFA